MGRKTSRKARKAAAIGAAVAALAGADHSLNNRYAFEDIEVVDSDTYRGAVQLWPGLYKKIDVRLAGIDTPEKFRPSRECREHERALANKATAFARSALARAQRIDITGVGLGKYAGRAVAEVILIHPTGMETQMTGLLIGRGYGVEYHGGKKVMDWCKVTF